MSTTLTLTRSTDSLTRRRTGLYGRLNAEWDGLASHPCPTSWACFDALAPYLTPGDVLSANRGCNAAGSDTILIALLDLNARSDDLAGRTVLQAFLGKIHRLSHTAAGRGVTDPVETTLASAWEAIRSHPLHLRTSISGNLSLEILRRLPTPGPRDLPEGDHHCLETLGTPAWSNTTEEPTAHLIDTLTWALDSHTLSPDDVRLLARMHLAEDAKEIRLYDIAEEMGIGYAAAQRRHSRATKRLRDAVVTDLARHPTRC